MIKLSKTEQSKLSDKKLFEAIKAAHDEAVHLDRSATPFAWVGLAFLTLILFSDNKLVVMTSFILQMLCIAIFAVLTIRSIGWRRYAISLLDESMRRTKIELDEMISELRSKLSTADAKVDQE